MGAEERVTYCRICEPLCGLVATVEDGRVTKLRRSVLAAAWLTFSFTSARITTSSWASGGRV
jgi:hypothetical protein